MYTLFDLILAAWLGFALAMLITSTALGRRIGLQPIVLFMIPLLWLVIRSRM